MRPVLRTTLQSKTSADRWFTEVDGRLGAGLGIDEAWAIRAIEAVGHFGETRVADLGSKSPLRVPRGLDPSWTTGGESGIATTSPEGKSCDRC